MGAYSDLIPQLGVVPPPPSPSKNPGYATDCIDVFNFSDKRTRYSTMDVCENQLPNRLKWGTYLLVSLTLNFLLAPICRVKAPFSKGTLFQDP